jgi:hypothetical protein
MAIHEDLIYFLKNGKLKNINYGVTKEQLTKLLGAPEYTYLTKGADLYGYDNFEFYIRKETWKNNKSERLECIVVNNPKSYSRKGNLFFKSYGWTTKLTIEKAIAFLNKHEIKFEEKEYPFEKDSLENDVRSFVTEGKVFIQFRDWELTGNFMLYKFGREVELSSIKPPTKQISFEIEEVYYKQLKYTAEKTKVSIANLCREIVENHLENNE